MFRSQMIYATKDDFMTPRSRMSKKSRSKKHIKPTNYRQKSQKKRKSKVDHLLQKYIQQNDQLKKQNIE